MIKKEERSSLEQSIYDAFVDGYCKKFPHLTRDEAIKQLNEELREASSE